MPLSLFNIKPKEYSKLSYYLCKTLTIHITFYVVLISIARSILKNTVLNKKLRMNKSLSAFIFLNAQNAYFIHSLMRSQAVFFQDWLLQL